MSGNPLDDIKKMVNDSINNAVYQPEVIPTRYPYTYSADFLRMHDELIPIEYLQERDIAWGQPLSRADAAGIKSSWAKDLGVDERKLACIFADGYLKENNFKDWTPPHE